WVVDVHEERVGDLAILLLVDAARRGHAKRELSADGQEQRRDRVIEEVGGDSTRVIPVLPPPEVALRIEGAFGGGPDELFPVERLLGRLRVDRVVPLATLVAVAPE